MGPLQTGSGSVPKPAKPLQFGPILRVWIHWVKTVNTRVSGPFNPDFGLSWLMIIVASQ